MRTHPLPWSVGPLSRLILDSDGDQVVLLQDEASARLIVDAVNGRDVVAACHEALAELDQTRWEMSCSSMRAWGETVEGRTFARVQKARDLLMGIRAVRGEGSQHDLPSRTAEADAIIGYADPSASRLPRSVAENGAVTSQRRPRE